MLIMITGLPGSGKTTFANAFATSLNAVHINTEFIQQRLRDRAENGVYFKSTVYAKMLKQTESFLHKNKKVVVDATFYKAALRKPYLQLAKKYKKKIYWFYITAEETIIEDRLKRPKEDSDVDFDIYLTFKDIFQPLNEKHLMIPSDVNSLEEMLLKANDYIKIREF